jgi:hypothetical protein
MFAYPIAAVSLLVLLVVLFCSGWMRLRLVRRGTCRDRGRHGRMLLSIVHVFAKILCFDLRFNFW